MTLIKINTYTKYILAIVMGVAMFFVFTLSVEAQATETPGTGEADRGCTDPLATNYRPNLDGDDGSCQYITPTCDSFKASDKTINYGESTTLTWETSYASDVTMTRPKGTPTVDADGSLVVTPKKDFTFKLNLTNPIGQTATCKKKITVIPPPAPTCNITSDKSTLEKGDTATLSWTSTDVDQAILTRPFGDQEVDNNTTLLVSPNETHNFELKVTNPTGEATCAVNIDVTEPAVPPAPRDPATCTLVASPDLVPVGGADVTFTWTTQNTNGAALWDAGKTADGNGGINPLPGTDSSYTMFVTPGTKTFQVWNEVSNNTCTVEIYGRVDDTRPTRLQQLKNRLSELRIKANTKLQDLGVSEDAIHNAELQKKVRVAGKPEAIDFKAGLSGLSLADKIVALKAKLKELQYRAAARTLHEKEKRFSVGKQVVVTNDLNVRDNAFGNIIGQVVKGDSGIIVDGPAYTDDSRHLEWWKVDYDTGLVGWSVNGRLRILNANDAGDNLSDACRANGRWYEDGDAATNILVGKDLVTVSTGGEFICSNGLWQPKETYTIDDVVSITSEAVDPIPSASDDEYILYTITISTTAIDGSSNVSDIELTFEVKINGFFSAGNPNAVSDAFYATGYRGNVDDLIALATPVPSVLGASTTNIDYYFNEIESSLSRIIDSLQK